MTAALQLKLFCLKDNRVVVIWCSLRYARSIPTLQKPTLKYCIQLFRNTERCRHWDAIRESGAAWRIKRKHTTCKTWKRLARPASNQCTVIRPTESAQGSTAAMAPISERKLLLILKMIKQKSGNNSLVCCRKSHTQWTFKENHWFLTHFTVTTYKFLSRFLHWFSILSKLL